MRIGFGLRVRKGERGNLGKKKKKELHPTPKHGYRKLNLNVKRNTVCSPPRIFKPVSLRREVSSSGLILKRFSKFLPCSQNLSQRLDEHPVAHCYKPKENPGQSSCYCFHVFDFRISPFCAGLAHWEGVMNNQSVLSMRRMSHILPEMAWRGMRGKKRSREP